MKNRYHLEELRTYLRCPQQYMYTYHYGIDYTVGVTGELLFYSALRQMINWFFVATQDTAISWGNLSKRWESAWANIAADLDPIEAHEYLHRGFVVLNQFFWNLSDTLDVIFVDARLEVSFGEKDPIILSVDVFALLKGSISSGESTDEFTVIVLRNPIDPLPSLERDSVLDRLLFRAIYNEIPSFRKESKLRISIFNFQSGCWSHRIVQPDVGDVPLIQALGRGIDAKSFYPHIGNHCASCPFRPICHVDACSSDMIDQPDRARSYLRGCLIKNQKGELNGFKRYRKTRSDKTLPGNVQNGDGILRTNIVTGSSSTNRKG